MRASRGWVAVVLLACGVFAAFAGGTCSALAATTKLEVGAAVPWTSTGVMLAAGDRVTIKASREASWGGGFFAGPRGFRLAERPPGIERTCGETQKQSEAGGAPFAASGLNCYSLLYRVGSSGAAFEAGTGTTFSAKIGSELQLGYNDNAYGDNTGAFAAEVAVVPGPVISGATVAVLDGAARVTAMVSNAQTCSLSAALTKPLSGLPVTFPCSTAEAVFRMVVLPPLTATTPVKYPLTLAAKGPGGTTIVHLVAIDEPVSKGGTVPQLIEGGELDSCTARLTGSSENVWCWGSTSYGELGDELTSGWVNRPVHARELADVVGITGGGENNCALIGSGQVKCLGRGGYGVLGVGEPVPEQAILPVLVRGVRDAVQVTAGQVHACALLANGHVMCWGTNSSGQVGQPHGALIATPAEVPGVTEAIAIAAGRDHTCALLASRTVECWGSNDNGQLGADYGDELSVTPLQTGVKDAVSVAAGGNESCAVLVGGTVECWGRDEEGEVGNDEIKPAEPEASAVLGIKGAIQVSVGAEDACALLLEGTIRCWGGNAKGQLGNGSAQPTLTPEPVVTAAGELTGVVEIAAAYQHTCALLSGGAADCWGKDNYGELGIGEFAEKVTTARNIEFPQTAASRLRRQSRPHPRHKHHARCPRRRGSAPSRKRLVAKRVARCPTGNARHPAIGRPPAAFD